MWPSGDAPCDRFVTVLEKSKGTCKRSVNFCDLARLRQVIVLKRYVERVCSRSGLEGVCGPVWCPL